MSGGEAILQNSTESPLTRRQEEAARLVAEDEETDAAIASGLGIHRDTLEKWKRQPVFAARVEQHKEAFKDFALSTGFADKRERVKALNTVATALLQQLGQSQYQYVTFITEDGAHIYGFDTARLKEFRGTLDDIAKEMGDRRQGVDVRHSDADVAAAAERLAERTGIPKDRAIVDIRERLNRKAG